MALSYAQLDALTTNAAFLGRVRNAVANHASYWQVNAGATAAQKEWCTQVFVNQRCTPIAENLARELSQDPAITGSTNGDGSDVTDVNLQSAVGLICEKYT